MNRRSLIVVFVALALTALLTGCGPRWQVIAQAAPNPFRGQSRFAVLPIDYTNLTIGQKSEAQYLAEKEPEQRASFLEDKVGINQEFARALIEEAQSAGIVVVPATGPGSAPFEIRPHISFIEPGFYAVVAAAPSEVQMSVQITLPNGQILDEIALTSRTSGGLDVTASSGGRLRRDGNRLGNWVAKYLIERVTGE